MRARTTVLSWTCRRPIYHNWQYDSQPYRVAKCRIVLCATVRSEVSRWFGVLRATVFFHVSIYPWISLSSFVPEATASTTMTLPLSQGGIIPRECRHGTLCIDKKKCVFTITGIPAAIIGCILTGQKVCCNETIVQCSLPPLNWYMGNLVKGDVFLWISFSLLVLSVKGQGNTIAYSSCWSVCWTKSDLLLPLGFRTALLQKAFSEDWIGKPSGSEDEGYASDKDITDGIVRPGKFMMCLASTQHQMDKCVWEHQNQLQITHPSCQYITFLMHTKPLKDSKKLVDLQSIPYIL